MGLPVLRHGEQLLHPYRRGFVHFLDEAERTAALSEVRRRWAVARWDAGEEAPACRPPPLAACRHAPPAPPNRPNPHPLPPRQMAGHLYAPGHALALELLRGGSEQEHAAQVQRAAAAATAVACGHHAPPPSAPMAQQGAGDGGEQQEQRAQQVAAAAAEPAAAAAARAPPAAARQASLLPPGQAPPPPGPGLVFRLVVCNLDPGLDEPGLADYFRWVGACARACACARARVWVSGSATGDEHGGGGDGRSSR